jgi:hypothetical protein
VHLYRSRPSDAPKRASNGYRRTGLSPTRFVRGPIESGLSSPPLGPLRGSEFDRPLSWPYKDSGAGAPRAFGSEPIAPARWAVDQMPSSRRCGSPISGDGGLGTCGRFSPSSEYTHAIALACRKSAAVTKALNIGRASVYRVLEAG